MDEEPKIAWADRLDNFPLLRILLLERWFRLAFLLFLIVLIGAVLFLPKIWVRSPKDFLPVVKISLLDLVQASSLKRTARKAAATGRYEEANYAWQTALANNRADVEASRELLRNFLDHETAIKQTRYIVPHAVWLLRLTATNLTDLELAAEVLNRKGYSDYVATLLATRRDSLTPRLESIYLKTLFDLGNLQAFAAHWEKVGSKFEADTELGLYRAAYLAIRGSPAEAVEALNQLEESFSDPARRVLACRLRLTVSEQRNEIADYERFLQQLQEWRADTLLQHVGYWKILIASGRPARAAELALAYPGAPLAPGELIELAHVFSRAGRRDRALELFVRYNVEFATAPNFWIAYANELIEGRNWKELQGLGAQIRAQPAAADALAGFSYFLDGRAEAALQRPEIADAAFGKMVERGFEYPQLGLRTATELLALRRPAFARDVLVKLQAELAGDPNYWTTLFAAAEGVKDCDLMLQAARQSYALLPTNPSIMNNYAAALLIMRQNPEEAVRLTLQLIAQNPSSIVTKINHSAALLLNERPGEAEAILKTVKTNTLSRAEMTVYNLDLLEAQYRLGRFDQARILAEKIEEEFIYPPQRAWLAKVRKQLPADDKPYKPEGKG